MTSENIYTRKGLFIIDTSIADFHTSFYITGIQNIVFLLPHVRILGNNNCGNTFLKSFKRHRANQDMLFRPDYAEIMVASFSHQIHSDY